MKQILYGGGSFVTCDDIASELLEYGVELASHGVAASVAIPIRLDDGSDAIGTVLLGPASQLVVMPDGLDGDLDCESAISSMREHRASLMASASRTTTWSDTVGSSMIDPI
jgi:hypothetical protein